MARVDFNVEEIDALRLDVGEALTDRDWMSPFVWADKGGFSMLARAVPANVAEAGYTGAIHYGRGRDGLSFTMDETPILAPGPGPLDIGGCEDPTVVKRNGEYVVYYTGVDDSLCSGQMLYASGPDLKHLTKRGVAYASSKSEGNTKEATIERTADDRWRLFFEFANLGASRIGLALGDGVGGPWREQDPPFAPRSNRWDNWHLSTGPLLTSNPDMPVMFYNGATQDARWRIGWVAFNRDCTSVVDRCIEPLIVPPPPLERTATDIAFAASVVVSGKHCHLYYSLADKMLFRATLRRS
ncbi:MAG: glycosidase [Alphaproteobacteria bacterium]